MLYIGKCSGGLEVDDQPGVELSHGPEIGRRGRGSGKGKPRRKIFGRVDLEGWRLGLRVTWKELKNIKHPFTASF